LFLAASAALLSQLSFVEEISVRPTASSFEGCVLGLALGDALGAPHEGGTLERLLWRLIGRTKLGEMRWTDDTQMTLDVAESLAKQGTVDPDDLASRFAASYRWSRGYGPTTSKVLKRVAKGGHWQQASRSVYRDGSFGNGAAMRAPVIGLFYANRNLELDDAARRSAIVTHAHESWSCRSCAHCEGNCRGGARRVIERDSEISERVH
jgi:ADP-ribosylglycohydrolase